MDKGKKKKAPNLSNNLLNKLRQPLIHIIRNDPHALRLPGIQRLLHVARHILLQHSPYIPPLLLILRKNRLAAQQPAFLGTVPMKLDRVHILACLDGARIQQHAHGLEDGDGAAAVVVGAGCSQEGRQEEVDAVLVRADDDGFVGLAGDRRDDAGLAPGVREGGGVGVVGCAGSRDDGVDALEEPGGRGGARGGFVVARVEGGEFFEVLAHLFFGKGVEEGEEGVVVGDFFGEGRGAFFRAGGLEGVVLEAEEGGGGDVHEVDVLLLAGVSSRASLDSYI